MQVRPDDGWEHWRAEIGSKVRDLRLSRKWSQAELAQRLYLSQARLSQLERGNGSFSAEHLLEMLRIFNVDVGHFAARQPSRGNVHARADELQNALARLGASHLLENENVIVSERWAEINTLIREVLVEPISSRLLTALAPVLVRHADAVRFAVIDGQLAGLGLQHRLGWVVENTLIALQDLDPLHGRAKSSPLATRRQHRRAQLILENWLAPAKARAVARAEDDILDPSVRSNASLEALKKNNSPVSRSWGVVSALQPGDFERAIEAADAPH